jgi:hypothetical protein
VHRTPLKYLAGLAAGALLISATAGPLAASAFGAHARAAAGSHHPRRGAGFVGVSSQKAGQFNLPVDLRAAPNGLSVARFDIYWFAPCQSQTGPTLPPGESITLNRPVAANGSFGATNTVNLVFPNGIKATSVIKLFGLFTSPTRAGGTFSVHLVLTDQNGNPANTCDTGNVSWSVTD